MGKSTKHYLLWASIIILLGINLLMWGIFNFEKAHANRILPGIMVGNVPLAHLSKQEAGSIIDDLKESLLHQSVVLEIETKTFEPTLSDLGFDIDKDKTADVALRYGREYWFNLPKLVYIIFSSKPKEVAIAYTVDGTKLRQYLDKISQGIVKEPKNMSLVYQDGAVQIVAAEAGLKLNVDELEHKIKSQAAPNRVPTVHVSLVQQIPEINDESQVRDAKQQLEKLLSGNLKIQADDVTIELKPQEIYEMIEFQTKDGQLTLNFNADNVKDQIAAIAKKVDIVPVAKRIQSTDSAVLDEGRDGRNLKRDEATQLLATYLAQGDFATTLSLPTEKTERKTITQTPAYQLGRFAGRYLEVDLSEQLLFQIDNSTLHGTYEVSTGKWSSPTPKGEFSIKNHIRTAWSNRYKLYMPWWMGIQDANGSYDGYGVHGLPYWPGGKVEGESHLGRQVSHGCIRLSWADAGTLYNWTVDGETKIFIHD